jgi:hypothetical protein
MRASLAVIVLAGWAAVTAAQGPQGQLAQAEAAKGYPSPNAVFDACREAVANQDTRAELRCYTPDAIDEAIFEAMFECSTKNTPQIRTVEYRFGMTPTRIMMDYTWQWCAIHKRLPQDDDKRDDALMWKVMRDRVPDPVAYIGAMREACRHPDDKPKRFGPLKSVSIKDDTAVGTFTWDDFAYPINFRKTKDGWLIDACGWGD